MSSAALSGRAGLFTSPLCGFRFEEGAEACAGCPLADRCSTICCPHCGYRFVWGSRIWNALRRMLRRTRPRSKESEP